MKKHLRGYNWETWRINPENYFNWLMIWLVLSTNRKLLSKWIHMCLHELVYWFPLLEKNKLRNWTPPRFTASRFSALTCYYVREIPITHFDDPSLSHGYIKFEFCCMTLVFWFSSLTASNYRWKDKTSCNTRALSAWLTLPSEELAASADELHRRSFFLCDLKGNLYVGGHNWEIITLYSMTVEDHACSWKLSCSVH